MPQIVLKDMAMLLKLVAGVAGLAWAGAIALECARHLWSGEAFGWAILVTIPGNLISLLLLPIMAGVMLFDWWAQGPSRPSLLSSLPARRYDLFFVLAEATGIISLLTLAFTFGLSAWAGSIIAGFPAWRALGETPLWMQVPLAYLVASFGTYWAHRLMHTSLLWPLHAMHHATEDLTALSDCREHPLESFFKGTPVAVLFAPLGFHPDAILLLIVIGRSQAALAHSSAPFPLWLERWVLMGPAMHRVHHAIAIEHRDRNFGILVIWDRLFGTFSLPANARTLRTGVDDARCYTGRPMHDVIAVIGLWLATLRDALPARLPRVSLRSLSSAAN